MRIQAKRIAALAVVCLLVIPPLAAEVRQDPVRSVHHPAAFESLVLFHVSYWISELLTITPIPVPIPLESSPPASGSTNGGDEECPPEEDCGSLMIPPG